MLYTRGVNLIQCCGPHLHTWILYVPDSIEKKFKQARLYISGPQTFLSAGTENQLIKFRGTRAAKFFYKNKDLFAAVSCVLSKVAIVPKLIKNRIAGHTFHNSALHLTRN